MVYDVECLIDRCFPSPLLLKYPPCFRKCASEVCNLSVCMHTSEIDVGDGKSSPLWSGHANNLGNKLSNTQGYANMIDERVKF